MDKPCGELLLLVVLVGLQGSGGPGDALVLVAACSFGFAVTVLAGILVLPD